MIAGLLLLLSAQTLRPPPPTWDPFYIFFDFGGAALDDQQLVLIENAAKAARHTGFGRFEIVGHADRTGPSSYNLELARRRATAVKDALAKRGIPPQAIVVKAAGENAPLVPTKDGVAEARNRFATIMIWPAD